MSVIIITAAELASELGTDSRTVRKFLRSITPRDEQPGKGSRWGIKGNKQNIAALRKKFTAFETEQEAKRDARAAAKAKAKADNVPETDDELYATLDELDGPTDAELADAELDA